MSSTLATRYLFISLKSIRPISSKVWSELLTHLRGMKVKHETSFAWVDQVEGAGKGKLRLRIEIVDPVLPSGWRQNELMDKFRGELGRIEIDPKRTQLKIGSVYDG